MKCEKAREIIENIVEDPAADRSGSLDEHLKICRECAVYLKGLERTWEALGTFPSIRPSPDFSERLHQKIGARRPGRMAAFGWPRWPSWQFAAAGACLLIFGIFLSLRFGLPPSLQDSARITSSVEDTRDERFLQELDQSLQKTAGDFLGVFDSWPESAPDLTSMEPQSAEPSQRPDERGKNAS